MCTAYRSCDKKYSIVEDHYMALFIGSEHELKGTSLHTNNTYIIMSLNTLTKLILRVCCDLLAYITLTYVVKPLSEFEYDN